MFSLRLSFHLKVSRLNYSQMVFLFSFNKEIYTEGVEEPSVIFILLSSLFAHSKKVELFDSQITIFELVLLNESL